jgi:hypothetical protein
MTIAETYHHSLTRADIAPEAVKRFFAMSKNSRTIANCFCTGTRIEGSIHFETLLSV